MLALLIIVVFLLFVIPALILWIGKAIFTYVPGRRNMRKMSETGAEEAHTGILRK
jgi:hypothetical protein